MFFLQNPQPMQAPKRKAHSGASASEQNAKKQKTQTSPKPPVKRQNSIFNLLDP